MMIANNYDKEDSNDNNQNNVENMNKTGDKCSDNDMIKLVIIFNVPVDILIIFIMILIDK